MPSKNGWGVVMFGYVSKRKPKHEYRKKCDFLYKNLNNIQKITLFAIFVFLFGIMKASYVQFEASKNISTKWGRCLDVQSALECFVEV